MDYKYHRIRVVLSRYTGKDVETMSIKGVICENDRDIADAKAKELIEEMFNQRLMHNICPGRGFDPMKYSITKIGGASWYIWHDLNDMYSDNSRPAIVARLEPVTCDFHPGYNMITYNSMHISMLHKKWYVVNEFTGHAYGAIDYDMSLNDILGKADKLREDFDHQFDEPGLHEWSAVLEDN